MTRRDTWAGDKVRPAVQRWRAFRDAVQAAKVEIRDGDSIEFHVAMPESWSRKKRESAFGTPHRGKPDLDNLLGGLFDAAMPKGDQHIASLGKVSKVWGFGGEIWITPSE